MKRFLFVLSLLLSFSVNAVDPKPGINFKKTKEEIATDSPGKIEVVEMFWYGCIHCYKIDPYLDEWADNLPEDVVFKKVPAVPRKNWVPMAKAYYALETLELDKKLHEKLFDAIHKTKTVDIGSEQSAINWIAVTSKKDIKDVEAAFKTFSMNAKISNSYKMFRAAGATGVPAIIIDGKYLTSSTMAGGEKNTIELIDYIIDNVRNDKVKN
jgi:thiol:disulfide interchange protein DsbA